jgi:hypothetical protein
MADEVVVEDDDIDTLKQKLAEADEERNKLLERTQQAEREAAEAREVAKNAGGRVQQNELDIVKGGIDNLKTQRDILKAKKREARAAGDDALVDEIDDQLTDAAVKLHRLEEGKAILEVQASTPPAPSGAPLKPFMSLTRTEKAERIASGLTPASAAWVRARPDLVQTPEQVNALVGAHHIAINKGIVPDTTEYFADVASTLGVTQAAVKTPAVDDATSAAATATQRRDAPPPAAPASRGGGNGSLARHLTPEEVEIATSSGLTPEEYAANKEALSKEGRLGTKH